MQSKIKRTTFGVASSHIISSSTLFPFLWLFIGLLFKPFILSQHYVPDIMVSFIYYLIMLGAYYLGIKYSLSYINKKVLVMLPKKSSNLAIGLFFLLILVAHYGFYYFEESISLLRVIFTVFLFLLFKSMSEKYFNSLGESDYVECSFLGQTLVIFSNLSVLLALLGISYILEQWSSFTLVSYLAPLAILMGMWFTNLFPEPFYKKEESSPLKKATILLVVSLLVNGGLFIFMMGID